MLDMILPAPMRFSENTKNVFVHAKDVVLAYKIGMHWSRANVDDEN